MPTRTPRTIVAFVVAALLLAQTPLPHLTPTAEAAFSSSFFQSLSSLFGVEKAKTAWSKVFGSVPASSQVGQVVGGGVALPELPREYIDTTYQAPTGTTCTANTSAEFQNCLNTTPLNSTIVLQAGTVYTGPFTLPNKTSGSGWIYIVSSNLASLPTPGTRASPSDAGNMPTLVTGDSSNPAIRTQSNAHHYRFVGIHMRPTTGTFVYQVVTIGNGETSESLLPRNITFDRCYIHGDSMAGSRRGIAMDGASIAVIDSYLSDFKEMGADTQALLATNGTGPFNIVNNYLEAAGENVMFGGADAAIADLVPSDIEMRGNYFFKPLSWISAGWSIKNLLEFKNARRALIEGNVFENAPLAAQQGFGILFTVRNQNGGNPWADVSDMTFRYNKLLNFGSGINILGRDDPVSGGGYSQVSSRISVDNNVLLITRLNNAAGRLFQTVAGPRDVSFRHNTGLITVSGGTMSFVENNPVADQFDYRDNIVSFGDYGFLGTGTGTGLPTLNAYFTNWTLTSNAIIGPNYNSVYPTGNFWPSNVSAVGFVDYAVGNYRLSASSPYRNAGTDGKDLGADIVALETATACALSGDCGLVTQSDTTPPTVSLTAPTADATVSGNTTASATASDDTAVAGVTFKLDGANLGAEDTTSPYSITWDTTQATNGSHTLTAVARDAAGNTTTSASRTVTVANTVPTPTTTLTASPTSITSGQSSTLTWSSTNASTCIGTGFTASGVSGSATVSPTVTTTYTLACTGAGGTATQSSTVTVTPASTTFTTNQRVQVVNGPVNVRQTANGTLLGTQALGNLGTITGGPTYAGGYWWWNINFDTGTDGWVAEDFLGAYTAPNTCTSFTYSAWSSCQPGDTQTRTVLTSSPSGCTGGTPVTTQSCTYIPPDTTSPTISSVTATNITTTSATVSWTTNEPSDTQVEYGTTLSYGQSTTRATTLTTSHSVTLSGLSAGTLYHYRVHSRDAAGNLATSEDYTVTTSLGSDTTVPTTPTNVTASALSPTSASLTWSASTDPTASGQTTSGMKQYRIYRCTGSTCTATTQVGTTTSLGYEDTTLTQGTTYRYRVRAEDNAGNLSAYSSSASVTTPATPPPSDTTPPTISSVSTPAITTDSVTITWDTNEPSDSTVRYGKTTLTETATDSTLVTSHSVTLSGLSRKTTYTYTVSSSDNAGNTATSPSYTVKTASGKPPKVTNLQAKNGSVILSWDAYADTLAESIEVYRATGNYTTPSGTPLATLDTTTTTYTDTDTTPGTRYFYTLVVADNDGTQSDPSYVSFTPQTTTTGGSSSGGSGSSSSGGGGGTSGGGGSSGTTDTPKTTPKNDTPKQATSGTTWRHTRTPATPSTQVVPASVAARYGMPYFTYRGIEADLLKVYDAGTMLILTVGSGSKLQKVSPTAQVYKDGEWHTIQLSRVWPLTTDGMLLGKGYYFLRPTDPLYTPTGAFTARMQMNLPGCDNATCNVNGELLQEWRSES